MQQLVSQIAKLVDQAISDNKINSFLPYRKGAKEFDYDAVGCSVLSLMMGQVVKPSYTFDKYRSQCLDHLKGRLSDASVLGDLEKMYFANEAIAKTAPEFLLLRSQAKENASTKHLIALFLGFFGEHTTQVSFESGTNFIEHIFLDILNGNLRKSKQVTSESCYLPFLADKFRDDMSFLSKHPEYLLDQLANCIELYTFIYCSQLGLNIKNWRSGDLPTSKPLYFILDTETASNERNDLMNYGYQSVESPMADVFPILSMLEHFNNDEKTRREPLWAFANAVINASPEERHVAFDSLKTFAERFREERKISPTPWTPENAIGAMQQLFVYAVNQFKEGTGRHRVQDQYMEVFDKEVAKSFVETRGRSGKVLVINQDFILLLTNIALADRREVRFQELLHEFQLRGFYFDKSSQQALITFYERVGNVDRKSDSGDAVYVRSTI